VELLTGFALRLNVDVGDAVELTNYGPGTVFYGTFFGVSLNNYSATLAPGQSVTLTSSVYFCTNVDSTTVEWHTPHQLSPWTAVNTQADLPSVGALGEVRMVLFDYSLHVWGADGQWHLIAGGASGGGGGGGSGGAPIYAQNLFIAASLPTSMTIDSLYIPVDGAGVPASIKDWEVWTGTGDGDGGNLVVSATRPTTRQVTCLWVPIDGSGVALNHTSWEVIQGTGGGGTVDNNMVLQSTRPTSATTGMLWVALTSGGAMRTADNWEVYA
jgi:hypothetical protein